MARLTRFRPGKPHPRLPRRLIAVVFLSLGILAELGYVLFFSPVLAVRSLIVMGDPALPVEEITAAIRTFESEKIGGVLPRDRLPFFESRALEARVLNSFFRVASLTNVVDWATGQVTVTLTPRKEAAIWCRPAPTTALPAGGVPACYYTDEAGVIFAEAPQSSGNILPIVTDERATDLVLGQAAAAAGVLAEILNTREQLLEREYQINAIRLRPARDFVFNVAPGYDLIFTIDDQPLAQISRLDEVMQAIGADAANLEYIDLRIGNKIFYRFKGVVE